MPGCPGDGVLSGGALPSCGAVVQSAVAPWLGGGALVAGALLANMEAPVGLVLLLWLGSLAPAPGSASSEAPPLVNEDVKRTVDLSSHLAKVTAEVVLAHPGGGSTSRVSSFVLALEPELESRLAHLGVQVSGEWAGLQHTGFLRRRGSLRRPGLAAGKVEGCLEGWCGGDSREVGVHRPTLPRVHSDTSAQASERRAPPTWQLRSPRRPLSPPVTTFHTTPQHRNILAVARCGASGA